MRLKIMTKLVLCAALLAILTSGCNSQLEKIAKDWALVIRACQIIPVYPLTEDLQPGDVLLVSTPIEDQVKLYTDKGYLPLDQLLVRLYADNDLLVNHRNDFKDFYQSRYGIDINIIPPQNWQNEPAKTSITGPTPALTVEPTKISTLNPIASPTPYAIERANWENAPHAAFPSYEFSAQTGSGLNLAIPFKGVPFALGLMNSRKIKGSVVIKDTYTFGLDNYRLEKIVSDWAQQNRSFLRNYKNYFLRVVSRVYLIGSVQIIISNDEAMGGNTSVGAGSPLDIISVKEKSTEENYQTIIQKINELAKEQSPGGEVKVVMASNRSVTLNESFKKPLVIGYIGFDIPILEGGRIGAPLSTLAQLSRQPIFQPVSPPLNDTFFQDYRLSALSNMYEALELCQNEKAATIHSKLNILASKLLPDKYPFSLYTLTNGQLKKDNDIITGAIIENKNFDKLIEYLGCAQTTILTLKNNTDSQLALNFQQADTSLKKIMSELLRDPDLLEAFDYVFLEN